MDLDKLDPRNTFVKDYLGIILENFDDGIYITDQEANTVYLNHSYELISGLRKSEMIGKNMKALVEDGVVSMSGSLLVLDTGEPVTSEQIFRTGKRAIITSTPVFEDEEKSNLIMVVTIVREITEIYSIRKELQRKEMQNRQYRLELERLQNELNGNVEFVAEDPQSIRLLEMAGKVAFLDVPVLFCGEKGVGKCWLAKYIHAHSNRAEAPFLRLDFAALSRTDLELYLFGTLPHTEQNAKVGVLESVQGGTIYIEELSEVTEEIQSKLVEILRDGHCVMRDGSLQKINIRLLAGSRYNVEQLQQMRTVNASLLELFSTLAVEVSPLRERKEDIIPLLQFFLNQYNYKAGQKKRFDRESYQCLSEYPWPGNIQELKNLVQHAAIISDQDVIHVPNLFIQSEMSVVEQEPTQALHYGEQVDLKLEVAKFEAGYMEHAFARFGNTREAAASLGMDSSTFVRKRQRYEQLGLMNSQKK